MKFRIIKYYDFYRPQVWDEDKKIWKDIGTSAGYSIMEFARTACKMYKEDHDKKIVEEFEL
jgi:hypothetical protein